MSSIGANYQIHHIPRTNGQSQGAKAAEIKMEIAKVKQQAQSGQISQEEAQQKLAMLEAKLARIQQGAEPEQQSMQVSEAVDFNTEVKTKDVDIVKTSVGFYVIKTNIGVSVTLGEDTIIPYLRSLLLVYPEVSSSMNAFINASQKAEKQLITAVGRITKLESEIKKKSEEFDLADDIMNENKKLISENKSLRNTVSLQKSQYGNLKAKHEKLTVTFQRLNALKDQLNTLFG